MMIAARLARAPRAALALMLIALINAMVTALSLLGRMIDGREDPLD